MQAPRGPKRPHGELPPCQEVREGSAPHAGLPASSSPTRGPPGAPAGHPRCQAWGSLTSPPLAPESGRPRALQN